MYPRKRDIFSSLFITLAIVLLDCAYAEQIGRDGDLKLIGGETATKNEFPWLVNFLTSSNVFCGGAILDRYWILTAGHCAQQVTTITVINAGDYNLFSVEDEEQNVVSEKVVVHEDYARNRRTGEMINDIALILLKTPLNFSAAIKSIDLPPPTLNTASGTVTVAGWGKTNINESHSALLKKANLDIVPLAQCQSQYSAVSIDVKKDSICTATTTRSTCDGDEGSPLICKHNSTSYVCGIYSFGGPCYVNANLSSVNTKVTSYLSWINGVMTNSNSSSIEGSKANVIFMTVMTLFSILPIITVS